MSGNMAKVFSQGMQHFTLKVWLKSEICVSLDRNERGEGWGVGRRSEGWGRGRNLTLNRGQKHFAKMWFCILFNHILSKSAFLVFIVIPDVICESLK